MENCKYRSMTMPKQKPLLDKGCSNYADKKCTKTDNDCAVSDIKAGLPSLPPLLKRGGGASNQHQAF